MDKRDKRQGNKRFVLFVAGIALLSGLNYGIAARAGELTAADILKQADDFAYQKNMNFKIDVTVEDKDGQKVYMKLEMFQKGIKRLLKFSEPADIAGFAILTKDPETIYVYEPSLNKVRRVASSGKKQSMLGLDFTIDEASTSSLAADYDPQLVEEKDGAYVLKLVQKAGLDKAWPVLKIVVSKATYQSTKIDYCDAKEKVHKTETRLNIVSKSGRKISGTMKMYDHNKKHSTTFEVTDASFETLDDELFSKRSLVREE